MKSLFALTLLAMLVACSGDGKKEILQSPCVGLDDSPCGPKRPANPDRMPA